MAVKYSRWARKAALFGLVALTAACGLPRPGPTKQQILAGAVERQGNAFVVPVNDQVIQATTVPPGLGFGHALRDAGVLPSDTINPGDLLAISIWENVDQGVLAQDGSAVTSLTGVQVDGQGFIFIPYAGRIKAAGNSPEALRQTITRQLENQTPDPQVLVTREAGDGSTVSIVGNVGVQGVYAIERPTRTLTAMLAQAGGITVDPEVVQITVTRDGRSGRIWLQDLYDRPENDIALRPGDRILVEEDARAYTAIGATGGQNRVSFDSRELSAIEAVGQVGGLSSATADPTGIFVLRDELPEVAARVTGRGDIAAPQRMIYLIDLTEPNGVFMARDFMIRDADTIYVTEAPFVQWQKVIGAITGTAGQAQTVANLADGN